MIAPFRHAGLKALAVGFGVLLWMIVSGEETVERGLRIPLELQQFPSGLELGSEAPSLVDVRVRGSSEALSRMGAGDIVAVLDLRLAAAGQRLFQLTAEQVRAPFGVQVVQVMPATIALAFEKTATREVPVVPNVEGVPAAGFVTGAVTVNPKVVDVIGPEGAVARVTQAVTSTVSVDGARRTISENVTVGFIDPSLRLKSPGLPTVTVEIVPGPQVRTLRDRPVRLMNTGPGLVATVTPAAAQVTIRGSQQSLSRVDAQDVNTFVDLDGLGPGDYGVYVKVDLPEGAGVTRIDPDTVKVHINRARD